MIDRQAQPLAAATVCAVRAGCNLYLPDTERSCARTDAIGNYELARLKPGEYVVSASAAGFVPKVANDGKPFAVSPPSSGKAPALDFTLDSGGASVTGIVLDVTGGPVAGATVQSTSGTEDTASAHVTQTTVTDAQGRFELSCPPGHIALLAIADGYAAGFASRTAPAKDVEVFVEPASTIEGVVVTDDGQPVGGMRVLAQAPGVLMREITSDDSGHFTLSGLRSGIYQLRATGEGWLGDYPATVTLSTADAVREVVITVRRAALVRGTLLSPDGTPCPYGQVHLGPGPRAYTVPVLDAVSGADGAVTFEAVPPGSYEVSIACGDPEPQRAPPLEVGTAEVTGMVWKVAPQLSIAGQVIDGRGQPVSKLLVELRTENTTPIMARSMVTGADGAFSFKGVTTGAYALRSPDLVEDTPVQVGDWSVTGLLLRARATGHIQVRVTTAEGAPVDGLSISASAAAGRPSDLPEELGDGVYRLGPLQTGAYAVYVGDGVNPRVRAGGAAAEVAVRDGETTEVAVQYGGYDGRIAGRVVDDQGAPVENVWVQARPAAAQDDPLADLQQMTVLSESRRSLTDREGHFEIDGLAESGTFNVTAEWPLGGQAQAQGVKAGATIDIVMEQLASLSGTARDPSGQPVAHLSLQVANAKTGQQRTEVIFDPNGKWQIDRVSPGTVQLIANDPNGHVTVTTLDVAPKQTMTGIQLQLAKR